MQMAGKRTVNSVPLPSSVSPPIRGGCWPRCRSQKMTLGPVCAVARRHRTKVREVAVPGLLSGPCEDRTVERIERSCLTLHSHALLDLEVPVQCLIRTGRVRSLRQGQSRGSRRARIASDLRAHVESLVRPAFRAGDSSLSCGIGADQIEASRSGRG